RAQQLLGIAAFLSLEAGRKTVGIVLESPTLGREAASAVLETALPDGRCPALDRHRLASSSRLVTSGATAPATWWASGRRRASEGRQRSRVEQPQEALGRGELGLQAGAAARHFRVLAPAL